MVRWCGLPDCAESSNERIANFHATVMTELLLENVIVVGTHDRGVEVV